MRSGSAGSAVLGTIHGNSPKAVFDRIVYDLDIHKEAFTATDIVVICGLVRPEGKQRQIRRVTSIAEVVKEGEPGRFEELLSYDEASDCLVETDRFRKSSSRISKIARDWGLAYQEAVDNIRARAAVREMLVRFSGQNQRLLAPDSVVLANSQFWSLVDRLGSKDPARLEEEWTAWFERSAPYV
jgi:flagellar protein FlaI